MFEKFKIIRFLKGSKKMKGCLYGIWFIVNYFYLVLKFITSSLGVNLFEFYRLGYYFINVLIIKKNFYVFVDFVLMVFYVYCLTYEN